MLPFHFVRDTHDYFLKPFTRFGSKHLFILIYHLSKPPLLPYPPAQFSVLKGERHDLLEIFGPV